MTYEQLLASAHRYISQTNDRRFPPHILALYLNAAQKLLPDEYYGLRKLRPRKTVAQWLAEHPGDGVM